MSKVNNKVKKKNKGEKYNTDNEIIIGVTTKPKNGTESNQKINYKNKKIKQKKIKRTSSKKKIKKEVLTKEQIIKKSNRKKVIISMLILFIIAVGAIIYCLTTPMFNIANIEITGNSKNSVETYISLSKIQLNSTNIFSITKSSIIKNIKENSYVNKVEVKRKLPNTLQINIEERKVAYQAEYNNQLIYIDEQGYILEINEEKNKNSISLKGLESTNGVLTEGQRLNNNDLLKLDTVLKIVNYCKYNSIENKIESLDISDTSNYTIYFSKNKQIAYLGDATNLSERILWLKTILEKEKGNKGEIFINGNVHDGKVYFKPITEKE